MLKKIGSDEKRCFLDIYDNKNIERTYASLFENIGQKHQVAGTIFGKMLYRYILQELRGK